MINSDSGTGAPQEAAVEGIVRSGAKGAVTLAGLATAIVIGIWFGFYFLVFVPRGPAP